MPALGRGLRGGQRGPARGLPFFQGRGPPAAPGLQDQEAVLSQDSQLDPEATRFFDGIIEKIVQHPQYSRNLADAVEARQRLILNYHTHGPGHGYCVSVSVKPRGLPVLGQKPLLEELAHIKGIASRPEECEFLMTVFGSRLKAYYELAETPEIYLDGNPLNS
jgi:hypothetical protein